MKNVCLAQWVNVNTNESGYSLEGVSSERIYFEGNTKDECLKFAANNSLRIAYEA